MNKLLLVLLIFISHTENLSALHLGVGYASATDGRPIPGLNAGFLLGQKYLITGSASGVSTKAYYSSAYTFNVIYSNNFGKTFFGEIHAGLGIGGMYGKKAILVETKDSHGADKEEVNEDGAFGPSFRVAVFPAKNFYIALEYMMGLGVGSYFHEQERNARRFEWLETLALAPLKNRAGAHNCARRV
jgi:hypothetical protein